MSLPSPVDPLAPTHGKDHATLKADYDTRHPDAPLPDYGQKGAIHEHIHELLAADHNALTQVDELQSVGITGWTIGHTAAHNALNAAYNDRNREETAT